MKHLIIHSTLVIAMVISGCGDSIEQGRPDGNSLPPRRQPDPQQTQQDDPIKSQEEILSDDDIKRIIRKGVIDADDSSKILRMIKNGDKLPKEIWEIILKETGTMRLLAETLVDGTSLGVNFSKATEKLVKEIVEDPKSYDELIEIFYNKLDLASVRCEWPDGLADEMMESIKKKVYDALAELKKAKDKLDLGLITQEEFNALRAELAAFD